MCLSINRFGRVVSSRCIVVIAVWSRLCRSWPMRGKGVVLGSFSTAASAPHMLCGQTLITLCHLHQTLLQIMISELSDALEARDLRRKPELVEVMLPSGSGEAPTLARDDGRNVRSGCVDGKRKCFEPSGSAQAQRCNEGILGKSRPSTRSSLCHAYWRRIGAVAGRPDMTTRPVDGDHPAYLQGHERLGRRSSRALAR